MGAQQPMPHDQGLPQTGDSQEIGQDAVDCLAVNRPRTWRLTPLDGDNDYGFDYQVQITAGQQVVHPFRLQLKGTRSPKLRADGSHLSIELLASTLRYYDNTEEPVLLVLCDLSADLNEPRSCPLYYVWMREELRRIRIDEVPLTQEKVTVHVPTANLLTRSTDLLEEVRKYHRLGKIGYELDTRMADMRPDLDAGERVVMLEGITEHIGARNVAFTEALAEPAHDIWINPPRGSLAWILTEARTSISAGRIAKCEALLLKAADNLATATSLEKAEYWHLTGRLHTIRGSEDAAVDAFKQATQLENQPKYWSAWAEAELRRRFRLDGSEDFSDVIAALPAGDDPILLSSKARLLAANRRYDDAIALLDSFGGEESLASRAVVQTMRSKSEEALKACEDGLALPGVPDNIRQLFLLLRARARFNLALRNAKRADKDEESTDDEILPPSGLPGTDSEALRMAWADIQEAADALDEIGWVTNTEFLVDIWVATACMLGKQKEIVARVLVAARARPTSESLQSAAEAIAAQCGDFESALEANSRIADGDLKILRRVSFLHESGKHGACLELMEKWVGKLDNSHQFYGSALMLAALSADVLARGDLVEAWRQLLRGGVVDHQAHAAALDYFLVRQRNKLTGDEPLIQLEKDDAQLGHPQATTVILFQELDPGRLDQAERFLTVAQRVRSRSRLSPWVALQIAIALSALERWSQLVDLCLEAEREFDTTGRIKAFQAFALDRLGRSEEARAILEKIIESGIDDGLALHTYVNIMVRWGYVDRAIEAAGKILEGAQNKDRKMECVRLLFNLEQNKDPSSARLVDLAFRLGELADPDTEIEEGAFISMVMTGTTSGRNQLTEDRKIQFSERANKFFEKFPDSKIIKRVEYAQEADGRDILKAMKAAIGLTEEREKAQVRLENQLQRGDLAIPYAWRPKFVLSNVQDVAHLWELAKRSSADDKKFHLNMVGSAWNALPSGDMKTRAPLIDLVTLFVLRDLDLIDELFAYFPKVAIAQQTLGELTKMTQVFTGSIWRDKCIELREKLKAHLGQILQPHFRPGEEEPHLSSASSEIENLVQNDSYLLYSDDVLFRVWCLKSDGPPGGMCTLDLLLALETTGRLTTDQVAQKLSLLCAWHVGINILLRHQIAAMPKEVSYARNVWSGVDVLQRSQGFMLIAGGIWDVRSDFLGGMRHVGSVIRELAQLSHVPTIAIASFVGVWFVKAKLRTDANLAPLQILCNVALSAVLPTVLDEVSTRRVWAVYLDLVEFQHGPLMDEEKEREARRMLAREAAVIDARLAAKGTGNATSLEARLMKGLTQKTEAADVFVKAYSDARVADAMKKGQ
jgi:tetratricopeptide (TPR) repeat protein